MRNSVGNSDTNQTPAAYIDGNVVTRDEIYQRMLPEHGGDVLAEIVLDRAVTRRLAQEDIGLTESDLNAERDLLLASLDTDPDQAARLLQTMRDRRGMNGRRFDATLKRNAGLRALVRSDIDVNEAAIRQAYAFRFGPRYRVRLIVTDDLDTLNAVRRQALQGTSFTDLAIEHSTDASASQGGLLSPISPADSTYPKAIRDALPKLGTQRPIDRVSPVIALDAEYALLYLEETITPQDTPEIDAVRAELTEAVRGEVELIRMRQLARSLIEQADVVTLDPVLEQSWQRQKSGIRDR
jgi:parvulin-like peptidyl-prolyl isomerase